MNLSKLQVDCLEAMGIELWQSRLSQVSLAEQNTQQSSEQGAAQSIQESTPEYASIAAPVIEEKSPSSAVPTAVSKTESATVQPPLLVVQLERALAYCQQQTKQSSKLSWLIDDSKTEIVRENGQLTLPNLTEVFASASLKRQLWQLISHTSEK